jgi:hypothetical protein
MTLNQANDRPHPVVVVWIHGDLRSDWSLLLGRIGNGFDSTDPVRCRGARVEQLELRAEGKEAMNEPTIRASLRPVAYDKHGPLYSAGQTRATIVKMILADDYFSKRGKKMSKDIQKANDLIEVATNEMQLSLDRFFALEEKFAENSKRVTGRIRDASTRLADGLARVEKAAAIPQLERHCALLEKMADSLERLAELQVSGKLDKISAALR